MGYNKNFYQCFFEEQSSPDGIESVFVKDKFKVDLKKIIYSLTNRREKLFKWILIPDYIDLNIDSKFQVLWLRQHNVGYAIDLIEVSDLTEYLHSRFRNRSKRILKNIRRLNICFDIECKVYNSTMDVAEFAFLMEKLRVMLTSRFAQRKEKNENLENWEFIFTKVERMLKQNKASLFVLYANNRPISISVLYHQENYTSSAITSFDINYGKFGMGHVRMYILLEWCKSQGVKHLDLGYGDLNFKKKWSNKLYGFKKLLLFKKFHLPSLFFAYTFYAWWYFKEKLKQNGFKEILEKYRFKNNNSRKRTSSFEQSNGYQLKGVIKGNSLNGFNPINLFNTDKLNKVICDFQYINYTHLNDIKVFSRIGVSSEYMVSNGDLAWHVILIE